MLHAKDRSVTDRDIVIGTFAFVRTINSGKTDHNLACQDAMAAILIMSQLQECTIAVEID
jgi:hypothetical protein